jgi:hypothetical protein
MGHSVLTCDFCDSSVMEGRNDWECDCGAYCNESTGWVWKNEEGLTKSQLQQPETNLEKLFLASFTLGDMLFFNTSAINFVFSDTLENAKVKATEEITDKVRPYNLSHKVQLLQIKEVPIELIIRAYNNYQV